MWVLNRYKHQFNRKSLEITNLELLAEEEIENETGMSFLNHFRTFNYKYMVIIEVRCSWLKYLGYQMEKLKLTDIAKNSTFLVKDQNSFAKIFLCKIHSWMGSPWHNW